MEPTRKLYENDSYKKEFSARVLDCQQKGDAWELLLEATGFFRRAAARGLTGGFCAPYQRRPPSPRSPCGCWTSTSARA